MWFFSAPMVSLRKFHPSEMLRCSLDYCSLFVRYLSAICPLLVQSMTEHILDKYCTSTEQECLQIPYSTIGTAKLFATLIQALPKLMSMPGVWLHFG